MKSVSSQHSMLGEDNHRLLPSNVHPDVPGFGEKRVSSLRTVKHEREALFLANQALDEERAQHVLTKLALVRELARAKHLEDEVFAIQERERARLGRDLHDGLCQHLTGIALMMEGIIMKLELSGQAGELVQTFQQIRDLQYAAIREARDVSHGLTPLELADPSRTNAVK